eukprot:scaffold192956_cov35-Tisochrysis_lutea.AAC.1
MIFNGPSIVTIRIPSPSPPLTWPLTRWPSSRSKKTKLILRAGADASAGAGAFLRDLVAQHMFLCFTPRLEALHEM